MRILMRIKEYLKFGFPSLRKKTQKVILFVGLMLITGIAAIWTFVSVPMSSLARLPRSPRPAIDVSDLSNPAKWHQVNQTPFVISPQVNTLCAAPSSIAIQERQRQNLHTDSAITVYVNEIGRVAMMSPKSIPFPEGSVIVKKKIDPRSLEDAALLYTVMTKNKLSFNPKAGGWEFAVVSGDGQQIEARGDLASCMECHIPKKQNDYVFRTYLPK
jgi:hypothetical protein